MWKKPVGVSKYHRYNQNSQAYCGASFALDGREAESIEAPKNSCDKCLTGVDTNDEIEDVILPDLDTL